MVILNQKCKKILMLLYMSLALSLVQGVVIGAKGASIISSVGTTMMINSLTSTINSICSIMGHITSYDLPYVHQINQQLVKMDLVYTVSVVEELVKERSKDKEITCSVKKALLGVHDILEKIHKELDEINKSIQYHSTKYFCNWRGFDSSCSINSLEKHKDILDKRYRILIDLLTVYN